MCDVVFFFFFSSRRRHTRSLCDWSSDVCSSDLDRFPTYASYARARIEDIFSSQELSAGVVKHAYTFATSLVRNNGDGSFTVIPLPAEAQRAPVYGILATDVDGDGHVDLLLAGNFDGIPPELGGRMSASAGLVLRGDGKGSLTPLE